MQNTPIPTIVIDDTPVKRRGICDFVEETPQLCLRAQAGDAASSTRLIESISEQQRLQNPTLAGWLVLSDLRLGNDNGVELGRALLELAPGLHIVIYTQDPSWTLATEIFRCEYSSKHGGGKPRHYYTRTGGGYGRRQPGLHGYALFANIEPAYLERIAIAVVRRHETFIDTVAWRGQAPPLLYTGFATPTSYSSGDPCGRHAHFLLKKLRGQRLTPRQEDCASLVAAGLSNDEIALHMGFLNAKGGPNMGPLENLVSELYTFFAIDGAPSDPGRRVLLAHAYEAYAGLRQQ